jgi:catechol 2,3-dioxygenase-like lactoylglutathione lyase family enzyme
VSDLKSSIDFYENVLGATVEIINDQQTDLSALCTWDVSSSESELQSVLSHQVEVGLIQLPKGLEMDFRDSQGRLVIETEAEALEGILLRAKRAGKEASGQIIYGPNARHGEKELIVTDEDGHKFSFVEASEQRTIPLKLQGGDTVDWDLRDAVIKKALNEDEESYGPNIKILQESTYNFHVATIDEDMLINFSAPWCIMCTRNHPTYQELARRITEVGLGLWS